MRWPWSRRSAPVVEVRRIEAHAKVSVHSVRPEDVTVTRHSISGMVTIAIGDEVTIFIDRDAGKIDGQESARAIAERISDTSTWRLL